MCLEVDSIRCVKRDTQEGCAIYAIEKLQTGRFMDGQVPISAQCARTLVFR
jgi:hypothetical protein